jgi:site-specific recombinase XerD
MTNQDYNRALKSVAYLCGINKKLHSHMARSTFATFALSHGATIQTVSTALGHTNVRMTMQRYAKILPESVIKDLDNLNELLKKK